MLQSPLDKTTYAAPVARAPWKDEGGVWHVSRYDEAQRVLNDPGTVVDQSLMRLMQRAQSAWPEKFTDWPVIFEILNLSNGGWHTAQRKTTAGLISKLSLDLSEDRLKQRLHDACAKCGEDGIDVISSVLDPVLNSWISEALELDVDRIADIRAAGNALVQTVGDGISKANVSSIESRSKKMVSLYAQAIGRDKPNWTSEDHAHLLLTVVALNAQIAFLSNVLEHLADHRALQDRLFQAPDAVRSYMFEAERFLVSSRFLHRLTGPDGVRLTSGDLPGTQIVVVDLAAANRDPARWQNPQVFDTTRPVRANLAFSYGIHRCLGVTVSRKIVPEFLNVFLRTVRAERSAPSCRTRNMSVDLLTSLPLRLSLLPGL